MNINSKVIQYVDSSQAKCFIRDNGYKSTHFLDINLNEINLEERIHLVMIIGQNDKECFLNWKDFLQLRLDGLRGK